MANEFRKVKTAVLGHVQSLFDEMEESMAMSHQEKYALLEDACENATDKDELRVALEQWYSEYGEELDMDRNVDEIWQEAIGLLEDDEMDLDEDDEENEDDDEDDEMDLDEEDEDRDLNYNNEYEK
jgi:Asp-tRNA(Asn)/Glu-tRNA(Gln) amidotransferase A subunit family amidase